MGITTAHRAGDDAAFNIDDCAPELVKVVPSHRLLSRASPARGGTAVSLALPLASEGGLKLTRGGSNAAPERSDLHRSPSPAAQQPHHAPEDPQRHLVLREQRQFLAARRRASMIVTRFVSVAKPALGAVTSFATMRSRPLRAIFARAFSRRSCVSAANPTLTKSPSSPAMMSSFGTSSTPRPSAPRLIFCSAAARRPEVRRRRRHDQRVAAVRRRAKRLRHLRGRPHVDALDPERRRPARPARSPAPRARRRRAPLRRLRTPSSPTIDCRCIAPGPSAPACPRR